MKIVGRLVGGSVLVELAQCEISALHAVKQMVAEFALAVQVDEESVSGVLPGVPTIVPLITAPPAKQTSKRGVVRKAEVSPASGGKRQKTCLQCRKVFAASPMQKVCSNACRSARARAAKNEVYLKLHPDAKPRGPQVNKASRLAMLKRIAEKDPLESASRTANRIREEEGA